MLILIVALAVSALFLSRSPRLAAASEVRSEKEVRAYIDGKPVDSYVRRNNDVRVSRREMRGPER